MPFEISVRVSVWLTESLMILRSGSLRSLAQVLARAVEDDDRVVHAVADEREQGRDHVERDLEAEEAPGTPA